MRLALAIWEGRISPVFDVAGPLSRAGRLSELGVETLICEALFGAAFLAGRIEEADFAMPGCCGRRARHGAGQRGTDPSGACSRKERKDAMPGKDGTGPEGKGQGSGRGKGPCGQGKGAGGQGMGRGMGRGGGLGKLRGGGQGKGGGQGRRQGGGGRKSGPS